MGVKIGRNIVSYAEKFNDARVDKAEQDALDSSKEYKIAVRNARLLENDLLEAEAGLVYEAGTTEWIKFTFLLIFHEKKNLNTFFRNCIFKASSLSHFYNFQLKYLRCGQYDFLQSHIRKKNYCKV